MSLTIKHKLILLGTIALLAVAFLTILSYMTNNYVNSQVIELDKIKKISNLDDTVKTHEQQITLLLYKILQQKNAGIKEKFLAELPLNEEKARDAWKGIILLKPDIIENDELVKGQELLETMIKNTELVVQAVKRNGSQQDVDTLLNDQQESAKLLQKSIQRINSTVENKAIVLDEIVSSSVATANELLVTVAMFTFAILIPFTHLIIGGITRPLAAITTIIEKLSKGNYGVEVKGTKKRDEVGTIARAVFELRNAVEKSITLQTMIDNLSVPVMVTSKDYTIIYANNASRAAIAKLERVLPVTAENIIGANMSIFDDDSEQKRLQITNQSQLPHQEKFLLGNEWLYLNTNMLTDINKQFCGTFVDWRIITEEVKSENSVKLAQENINSLIASASKGDLGQRIDAQQFEGFYKNLARSMNGLMDTIIEPISRSIDILATLSKGDLTRTMEGDYHGSFSDIQMALNTTINQLKSMVIQIKQSAGSVNVASGEISRGSIDLAGRTEQQASRLEETAASMEDLKATVNANSENAGNANNLSARARSIAEKGGKVVEEAVIAMSNIEKSSKRISDIIGLIDEIAFQTNLLALNAAVEAARAGDAGKGFAVVASEVRMLAGRSASASKEIKQLINDSAVEVKSGVALVNEAGERLKEIVSSVRQVADIVSEITSATVEQSAGIHEVNQVISEMDEATQQNAALVEENTAAAYSLVNQANRLSEMIQFFTISEDNNQIQPIAESQPRAIEPIGNVKMLPKQTSAISTGIKTVLKRSVKTNGAISSASDGWEEF